MLEIVKYEVERGILTVGFKDVEHRFVVYTSLAYDETKTKDELLQQAYIQARPAIEYERTLKEHSITTNQKGEPFTPEPPKPNKIIIYADDVVEFGPFDNEKTIQLNAEVFDQYGDPYDGEVEWASSYGLFSDNVLVMPKVDVYTEVTVTAKIGTVSENKVIRVFPYHEPEIVNDPVDSEMIAFAEAIIDFDARLRALEGGN